MSDFPTFHVISMDGGGIYGLATADLLKQLCLLDKSFLRQADLHRYLFAGTSAGAVNALLLAKEKDPRSFILNGGLDTFWRTSPIFDGPRDPWAWCASLIGLTPWFGHRAYLDSLEAIFGRNTKVRDLEHKVFVCAFDYRGHSFPTPAGGKSWGPCFYTNFFEAPGSEQLESPGWKTDRVADVAYAAAAPAGYRAFVDGLGDGGAALPTPELYTILSLGSVGRELVRRNQRLARRFEDADPHVSLLSMGVCSTPWYHWREYVSGLGYNAFWSWFPTNPLEGNWYPPIYDFDVSAPTSTSNQQARDLLGGAYFRLSPALFGPPTATPPELVAMLWSRNPQLKEWLIGEIEKAVKTEIARSAVAAAFEFLRSPGWRRGVHIEVGSLEAPVPDRP